MNETECQRLLEALRDFFFAQNATQLANTYAVLEEAVSFDLPIVDDWEMVEFAFNRLFIGPKAPIAVPFASVYLDSEPQVMGKSTLITRRIFEMLGVQSPWQDSLPDDHLSLELDACIRLSAIRQASDSSETEELWSYFLHEHLAKWLPLWIDQVRTAEQVPAAIRSVIDILGDWLAGEVRDLKSADMAIGL